MKKNRCCICKGPLENEWGNNPDGAIKNGRFLKFKPEDKCCNKCNKEYVIPGRIIQAFGSKNKMLGEK